MYINLPSKKAVGTTLLLSVISYILIGPLLADSMVGEMKEAENKSQCTYISSPTAGGCDCGYDGVSINKKYSLIYQLLRAPRDIFSAFTAPSSNWQCHCETGSLRKTIENGRCGYEEYFVYNSQAGNTQGR